MRAPCVVIVTGLPGAGKTTLARRLASDLGLPFFYKDGIKESLYDTLGWSDREWSKRLGIASIELLYLLVEAQLAAERPVLVESNFDAKLASPHFNNMRERYRFGVVQVHCRAARKVLLERFRARDGTMERHPGHVDITAIEEMTERLLHGPDESLDVSGALIVVDTTDFNSVNYAEILRSVRLATSECDEV